MVGFKPYLLSMSENIRDLESDERIVALAQTCPGVSSVVRLLVQRALMQDDPGFDPDQEPGYGFTWLKNNGFGAAVQKLLEVGFVRIREDRVLLVERSEHDSSGIIEERVDALVAVDPNVRVVYRALLLGIFQSSSGKNCLHPQWLETNGHTAAVQLLLKEGIVRKEIDPLLGEIFVLAKPEAGVE